MLIIKLFAFQFVNSYTSLYYIAFFRGVSCTHTVVLCSHLLQTMFLLSMRIQRKNMA